MGLLTVSLSSLLALQVIISAPADPISHPTTQPTLQQMRDEHKQLLDEEFVGLPKRDPMPIEKIISLKLDGGHLHVKPLLDFTNGPVAIGAPNWPGRMHVTIGTPESLMMHIKHVDLSDPALIATYTQIITGIDYLQISRDAESDKGLLSITLIQSRQFADENEDPIRLLVRYVSSIEGGPDLSINVSGASFAAIRRDHPETMQKYFLPILKDLNAAGLIRLSDAPTAWQVVGAEVKFDPQLEKTVIELVTKLSSTDFSARVEAEEILAKIGAPAAMVLMRQDHSKLPPDPRATVDSIIRTHSPLPAERVEELRKDLPFLCDTLLLDDPSLRDAAAKRIATLTGKTIDLPDTLKPEERAMRIDAFRATILPSTNPASAK